MTNNFFNPDPRGSGYSNRDNFRHIPFKDDGLFDSYEETPLEKSVLVITLISFFVLLYILLTGSYTS